MASGHRVVFLDRDGTINVDHGYVSEVARWEFTGRAQEALRALRDRGFLLAVVSNQAGVSDGRFSEDDVRRLHAHMEDRLAQDGVTLDAVVFCPHGRSGCGCRKPATGMARMVEDIVGPIDYRKSWVIGDKESDIGFGTNLGARTALIRSRYWEPETLRVPPGVIVDSLHAFSQLPV